ncbi:MAG TPA: hypothetical protein VK858_03425 [Longimicrobiales bacterium]|nr:hypothetical protein [Longimicrobiales bacterium]
MSLHRRAVRVRLTNERIVEGQIHITEGQSLTSFLSTKLYFLNLTDVEWSAGGAHGVLPHVSVRLGQIVWVEPLEPGLHLSSATLPSEESRSVELHVDHDVRLQVKMNVARETRMSDYLDANPGFLPLWSVRIVGSDEQVERVALNHGAIEIIRELERTDPKER